MASLSLESKGLLIGLDVNQISVIATMVFALYRYRYDVCEIINPRETFSMLVDGK